MLITQHPRTVCTGAVSNDRPTATVLHPAFQPLDHAAMARSKGG